MNQPSPKSDAAVRAATGDDVTAIQAIYAHYVLTGLASFEIDAPDVAEMRRRYEYLKSRGYPYLVTESGGTVTGYAYAGAYRARPAYHYTVENSVYVAPDALGHGYGRMLLEALIEACTGEGYRQMIAVIGDTANTPSIGLHTACGFNQVGMLPSSGYKMGRWVDSVIMQRPLGDGDTTEPA